MVTYTIEDSGDVLCFENEHGDLIAEGVINRYGDAYELQFLNDTHTAREETLVWSLLGEATQDGLQYRWEAYQERRSM